MSLSTNKLSPYQKYCCCRAAADDARAPALLSRARVLKSLLDREQLFLTDIGKSTCEAAARANMAHEWRLAFGGQLLQANTLGKCTVELGTYAQPVCVYTCVGV